MWNRLRRPRKTATREAIAAPAAEVGHGSGCFCSLCALTEILPTISIVRPYVSRTQRS